MGEVGVIVVGDQRCGKSTLIERFIYNRVADTRYKPTSFDKCFSEKLVNGARVAFTIWDTSGSPAFDSVRPLAYSEGDVFLVCFSVADPASLLSVRSRWVPEILKHRPDAPLVLCGCMAALREVGSQTVSPDQAMAICSEVGVSVYVDTSAIENANEVFEAFDMCALLSLQHRTEHARLERPVERSGSSNSGGPCRPASAAGGPARPGSAASAHSGHSTGKRPSPGTRTKPPAASPGGQLPPGSMVNSSSHHGSYSSVQDSPRGLSSLSGLLGPSDSASLPISAIDLFHHTAAVAPVHRQTRSIDSSAGGTILEDEVLNLTSPTAVAGPRSPRSLHKLLRPLSPLARPTSPLTRLTSATAASSPPDSPVTRAGLSLHRSLPTSPAKPPSSSSSSNSARPSLTNPGSPLDSQHHLHHNNHNHHNSPLHLRSFSQPVPQDPGYPGQEGDSDQGGNSAAAAGAGGDCHHPPPPAFSSFLVDQQVHKAHQVHQAHQAQLQQLQQQQQPDVILRASTSTSSFGCTARTAPATPGGSPPILPSRSTSPPPPRPPWPADSSPPPPPPSHLSTNSSSPPLQPCSSSSTPSSTGLRHRLGNSHPERNTEFSRGPNFRTSLPAPDTGSTRPPLPPLLPKSPSDQSGLGPPASRSGGSLGGTTGGTIGADSPVDLLAPAVAAAGSGQESGVRNARLAQLGVPDPKNYESLKSHTSTASQGSTGSKLSTASSLNSGLGGRNQFYLGPRDLDIPDTENPELLNNLEFVSPKAGVYRPVNVKHQSSGKKDKCSMM